MSSITRTVATCDLLLLKNIMEGCKGEKENNAGVVSDGHITKGIGCKAKEPELSSADEGAVENF